MRRYQLFVSLSVLCLVSLLSVPSYAVDWAGSHNPLAESGVSSTAQEIVSKVASAIEIIPPRVQWVVFTADWCGPCKLSIADFEEWMKRSGWRVGDSVLDHVRIVNATDPAVAAQYGITAFPTFRLVVNGATTLEHDRYPGRSALIKSYQDAARSLPPRGGPVPPETARCSAPGPTMPVGAISVGTLPGKDQAKEVISVLRPILGTGGRLTQTLTRTNAELLTPLGPDLALYVPAELTVVYTMTGSNKIQATFEGRKPAIRKGGWLAAEVEIHGGSLTENQAALGLSWFPDMSIALR